MVSSLSNAALERGADAPEDRLAAVDVARGVAVVAMVIYHCAWDLSELRLIATRVTAEPAWQVFARTIAASFLVLAGVGLALAHRDRVRWRPFLRRLAVVAGAATLITVATVLVFPDSYIFFGILHAIAVSSILALPFTRLPAWASAIAALLAGLAPLAFGGGILDAAPLAFLGLGSRVPVTNDWVPLLPWAAFVFAGIAAAKVGLPRRPAGAAASGRLGRALAWAGRHSLIVYLLHQPLLFGALSGIVQLTGPNPAAVAAPFARSCAASCAATGQPEAVCRATCTCTVEALRRAPLWADVMADRLSPEQNAEVGRLAQACFARSRPPG